ncbi:MAG: glutaredoxin [Methylococcales bacterium]|jgi:glutaredoxin|nr:glutaredoxin [Methylococcales bacterium]
MFLKLLREGLGRLVIFIDFITRPKQAKRSAEEQTRVEQETQHLSLYQFYACPFCVKTRRAMRRLNLPIETRNAADGSPHREDLLNGGGTIKAPCLRIDDNNNTTWMYESSDIITYLETRFGDDDTETIKAT